MAGSLNHIVDAETGEFRMDLIENLGDAQEALEECFHLIRIMSAGQMDTVNLFCDALKYPRIQHDMSE